MFASSMNLCAVTVTVKLLVIVAIATASVTDDTLGDESGELPTDIPVDPEKELSSVVPKDSEQPSETDGATVDSVTTALPASGTSTPAVTATTQGLTEPLSPYDEKHKGKVVVMKLTGAKKSDELYQKLRRLIVRLLNERARRRKLTTTADYVSTDSRLTRVMTESPPGSEVTESKLEEKLDETTIASEELESEGVTKVTSADTEDTGSGDVGEPEYLPLRIRRDLSLSDEAETPRVGSTDKDEFTDDSVEFLSGVPGTDDDDDTFAFVVCKPSSDGDEECLSAEDLAGLLKEHEDEIQDELKYPVVIETPDPDPQPVEETSVTQKPTIWEAHFGLFLTIIILLAICIIITIVCCICIRCRDREDSEKTPMTMEEGQKQPVSMSSPLSDDEIVCDEAPMLERENPALPQNGGGQHISKHDDDNGWVVPLEELIEMDPNQPEVENTRL